MDKIVTINKAKQFYSILKDQILSSQYNTGDKLPSIRDLAETFEISKTTVNLVIAMLVNEGLLKVREGMGTYVSKEPATVKPLGVMLFDFTSSMRVDTDILSHIQKNINTGYYLNLVDTSNNFTIFIEGLRRLIKSGVAGLIITPPKGNPTPEEYAQVLKLLNGQIPVSFVIREIAGIDADFYSMDLNKGIQKALEYFSALNRGRMALIKHDTPKFVNEEMQGIARASTDYNITVDSRWIIDWSDDSEVLTKRLLAVLPEVDCLIAPDSALYQMRDAIRATGRRIPEDLSIVAINDTVYAKMFYPQLTSLAFPVEKIGRFATTSLIERIEKHSGKPSLRKNFAPELIVRGS